MLLSKFSISLATAGLGFPFGKKRCHLHFACSSSSELMHHTAQMYVVATKHIFKRMISTIPRKPMLSYLTHYTSPTLLIKLGAWNDQGEVVKKTRSRKGTKRFAIEFSTKPYCHTYTHKKETRVHSYNYAVVRKK